MEREATISNVCNVSVSTSERFAAHSSQFLHSRLLILTKKPLCAKSSVFDISNHKSEALKSVSSNFLRLRLFMLKVIVLNLESSLRLIKNNFHLPKA
jgi:hypothetical protein